MLLLPLLLPIALAAPARSPPLKQMTDPPPPLPWQARYSLVEETSLVVTGTRQALDNKDWVEEEKAGAQLWDYHGGDNQRWLVFQKRGAGATLPGVGPLFRLVRKNSDFCLSFYHDKILEDSIPHKEADLLLVPCAEATEFFWSGKNLCAFLVQDKPYYCIEVKGVKNQYGNGTPLTINSQGDHRLIWEKVDPRTDV